MGDPRKKLSELCGRYAERKLDSKFFINAGTLCEEVTTLPDYDVDQDQDAIIFRFYTVLQNVDDGLSPEGDLELHIKRVAELIK